MIRASIALCTYNGERFLREQLASLVAQTVQPFEVIVCDDRSSDASVALVRQFAEKVPFPVTLFENKRNLGYVKNFEQAIARCNGDVIFLCDQDDIWHVEKIERCLEVFETNPDVGLVLHGFNWVDPDGAPYPGPSDRHGEERLSAEQLPQAFEGISIEVFMSPYPRAWCGCMMAFRRLFVTDIVPIFPGKGHDDWILKLLGALTDVRFLVDPLVNYRIHASNLNGRDVSKRTMMSYRWHRFLFKAGRIVRGHSKRGFYDAILRRIGQSAKPVRYPRLIQKYRDQIKWL